MVDSKENYKFYLEVKGSKIASIPPIFQNLFCKAIFCSTILASGHFKQIESNTNAPASLKALPSAYD